jgi:hypothetical protein
MKEVHFYWLIERTHSVSFIKVFELVNNYFPLSANWIQSKSFICEGVHILKNDFHLLVIECIWKSWFVSMLQLPRIIYMYICQLNALQKFLLWECTNLQELLTFVGQFDAFKEFNFLRCFNLKDLPSSIANWITTTKSFFSTNLPLIWCHLWLCFNCNFLNI